SSGLPELPRPGKTPRPDQKPSPERPLLGMPRAGALTIGRGPRSLEGYDGGWRHRSRPSEASLDEAGGQGHGGRWSVGGESLSQVFVLLPSGDQIGDDGLDGPAGRGQHGEGLDEVAGGEEILVFFGPLQRSSEPRLPALLFTLGLALPPRHLPEP